MNFLVLLYLTFLVTVTGSQDPCDSSSDEAQCSTNEICNNNACWTATRCTNGASCAGVPMTQCVSYYCQPLPCKATGQCVTGHVCSQDSTRSCVYPVYLQAREGHQFVLQFAESGTPGRYEEISWYKGSTDGSDRIVYDHPSVTRGEPMYYGEYCSGGVISCTTSEKGMLDKTSGDLTTYQVELNDEGYYYYKFYSPDSFSHNTGFKYEYHLEVYTISNVTIEGVPDDGFIEANTILLLACKANRIKPKASDMYLIINGIRQDGTSYYFPNGDGTFRQICRFSIKVIKEDGQTSVKCIVEPKYGERQETVVTVNVGYSPSGAVVIQPNKVQAYHGELVTLTCQAPSEAGNPPCDTYTWTKLEDKNKDVTSSSRFLFMMEDARAGNYICTCSNRFGSSNVSATAEVVFLHGSPPMKSSGLAAGSIAGILIAVLVVVAVVVVVVIVLKRYNLNFNIQKKAKTKARTQTQDNDVGSDSRPYATIDDDRINDDDYEQPGSDVFVVRDSPYEQIQGRDQPSNRAADGGYLNRGMLNDSNGHVAEAPTPYGDVL